MPHKGAPFALWSASFVHSLICPSKPRQVFLNLLLHNLVLRMPSMHCYKSVLILPIVLLPVVPAQQSCYWPNGSGIQPSQRTWVNFYPSQDSACCLEGEVCLSNGLCYGSWIGAVSSPCSTLRLTLPETTIHIASYVKTRLTREKDVPRRVYCQRLE